VSVTARPAGPFRAEVRPRRLELATGGEHTVAVALRDALGNTAGGQRIDLVAPGGAAATQSATTDARGQATFTLSAAAFRGNAHLLLRAGGRVVDSVESSCRRRSRRAPGSWRAGPAGRVAPV
jgi:hypothetical protein